MRRNQKSTSPHPIYWVFQTDGIFHETSQDKVYHATTKDLVEKYELIVEVDNSDISYGIGMIWLVYCLIYIDNKLNYVKLKH